MTIKVLKSIKIIRFIWSYTKSSIDCIALWAHMPALCNCFHFSLSNVLNGPSVDMKCAWSSLQMGESQRKLPWLAHCVQERGINSYLIQATAVLKGLWSEVWGPAAGASGEYILGLWPSHWARRFVWISTGNWLQMRHERSGLRPVGGVSPLPIWSTFAVRL